MAADVVAIFGLGNCGIGFSLWGFDFARTKPHRLKPMPLESEIPQRKCKVFCFLKNIR
jgi:hypothetical protein